MVYLKSIDAIGFKSFADQTNVQFDKGVTAIVGPNGAVKVILQMLLNGCWVNNRLNHYVAQKWKILSSQVQNIAKLKIMLKYS